MIAFIFGETDFPKYIYKKIKGKKNYLIIDLTRKNIFRKDKNSFQYQSDSLVKLFQF